jgi:hypothetical protein
MYRRGKHKPIHANRCRLAEIASCHALHISWLSSLRLLVSIIEPATGGTGSGAQHRTVEWLPGRQLADQCTGRGTYCRTRESALLAGAHIRARREAAR